MPVEFQFERITDQHEQMDIEKTISDVLGNRDEHWTVTVVGFLSMHGYIIDVAGPGVRWGECYPVQPMMLDDIKKHIRKLATYYCGHSLSGESSQATHQDPPVEVQP